MQITFRLILLTIRFSFSSSFVLSILFEKSNNLENDEANFKMQKKNGFVDFVNFFPKYSIYFAIRLEAIIINYRTKNRLQNSDFYGINRHANLSSTHNY